MLVQEFVTDRTSDEKHRANGRDLDRFVSRLSGEAVRAVEAGQICGPFEVPGGALLNDPPPLFVGKAVRDLRSGAR